MLRIKDAEAINWVPRALRTALTHLRYRRQNPPPPQPAPTQAATQVTVAPGGGSPRRWARGGGEGPLTRDTTPAGRAPRT